MRDGQARVIAACDAAACGLGLRSGMTIAHARALVPGLTVVEAEPERDRAGLERIAISLLQRFSPLVALDGSDGLLLDATGCAHLFGGEAAMLAEIVEHLEQNGITTHAVSAGTIGAAHALVRFGVRTPTRIVPSGDDASALSALPVAALRIGAEAANGLSRLGIERIGELGVLPRGPLARRYGAAIMLRLDQAMGRAHEPFNGICAPERIEVREAFAEPISAPEQFEQVLAILTERLCVRLGESLLGVRRADLWFHGVDGDKRVISVGTAAPSRDAQHLSKLLAMHLERVDPGFGVEAMVLAAPRVEQLAARQAATSLADEDIPRDLDRLVDTLLHRVGGGRVYRAAAVESDVPEHSVKRVAALSRPTGNTWPAEWPRPARLLTPPEPVETFALLPDHPPVQFTWRGRRYKVARADGPERIYGEWWRREAETTAVRDYFQVEDDAGARFWLFRSGDGVDPATGSHRWWLHGVFG